MTHLKCEMQLELQTPLQDVIYTTYFFLSFSIRFVRAWEFGRVREGLLERGLIKLLIEEAKEIQSWIGRNRSRFIPSSWAKQTNKEWELRIKDRDSIIELNIRRRGMLSLFLLFCKYRWNIIVENYGHKWLI